MISDLTADDGANETPLVSLPRRSKPVAPTGLQDFAIVEFAAFVEGEASQPVKAAIRESVSALAQARTWTIAAPRFVEYTEGGIPICGAVLGIYDAYSARGEVLPVEVDAAHLDEVTALLFGLAPASGQLRVGIAVTLGGCGVGWIENGLLDDGLREALLEEWRKALQEKSSAGP